MAFGIQLLTTDGAKADMNFNAARFVSKFEHFSSTNEDVSPPAGVIVGETLLSEQVNISTLIQTHEVSYNAATNKIELRLLDGYVFSSGQAPAHFIWLAFNFT
jgi:hypothetical protein